MQFPLMLVLKEQHCLLTASGDTIKDGRTDHGNPQGSGQRFSNLAIFKTRGLQGPASTIPLIHYSVHPVKICQFHSGMKQENKGSTGSEGNMTFSAANIVFCDSLASVVPLSFSHFLKLLTLPLTTIDCSW